MNRFTVLLNVECSALYDPQGVAKLIALYLAPLAESGIEIGVVMDAKRLDQNIQPEEQVWE